MKHIIYISLPNRSRFVIFALLFSIGDQIDKKFAFFLCSFCERYLSVLLKHSIPLDEGRLIRKGKMNTKTNYIIILNVLSSSLSHVDCIAEPWISEINEQLHMKYFH